MSNNKRSSIELFIEQLEEMGELRDCTYLGLIQLNIDTNEYLALKEQAIAMHKEEIKTYIKGYSEGYKRALDYMTFSIEKQIKARNNE